MKKMNLLFYLLLMAFLFQGCNEITIELNHVPKNTPNEPIYVSGNFNYWDPGDARYIMQPKPDSSGYFIRLPQGFGRLEYKFTRGNWKTVEGDKCGFEIENRIRSFWSNDEVLIDSVKSWKDLNPIDCEYITLIIDELPENTPLQDAICIAGDFNQWGNTDSNFTFTTDEKGKKILKLIKPLGVNQIEFKITRGNLATSESDAFGNDIQPRKLNFNMNDSLHISIDNWVDIAKASKQFLTLIIDNYPPSNEPLFLASNLNNWYPKDANFRFQKGPNGKQYLTLPNQPQNFEYKITRGAWEFEEVDKYGNLIPNRYYSRKKDIDTVHFSVDAWKDRTEFKSGNITILVKVPKNTNGDNIYIASDINNWDERDRNFKLSKLTDEVYYFTTKKSRNPFNFKFTRGSWDAVEVDKFGKEIENRIFKYQGSDTVKLKVENWNDKIFEDSPNITIVIDKFPLNTPKADKLYLAADFTGMWWSADDDDYSFKKGNDRKYYLTFKKPSATMEFKITRGDWSNVESEINGDDIENRYVEFGATDTIRIEVKGWKDLAN